MALAWTLPNGFKGTTNSAGDTVLALTRPNQTFRVRITGDARTSKLILKRLNRRRGDIATIDIELGETPNIAIELRDNSEEGPLLLPAATFSDQQFVTDGIYTSARFRLVFTGTVWRYLDSQFPA